LECNNKLKKGYSYLIKPIQVCIDILTIITIVYYISDVEYLNIYFLSYISFFWSIISIFSGFYNVFRYTNFLRILNLITKHFLIFTLGYFAFFGIFREGIVVNNQFLILSLIFLCTTFFKLFFYFVLKKYRALGKNNKRVIVVGFDSSVYKIIKLFENQPHLGYKFLGFFSEKIHNEDSYLGSLKKISDFSNKNAVDEIYASGSALKKEQIKEITKLANKHNIQLKLVPNPDEIYSKNQKVEFYDDAIKVFSVSKLPFEFSDNRLIKRIFDIAFSFFIILFLMSWLTPFLWVLIKLESKGSLFFKQEREGLNGSKFVCYKFRSMKKNILSDKIHATKNDTRVTKIGSFIRKTSIDELPQFFNVFLGDMSVVGPRPHMGSLALEYEKDVDNYMDRHTVKPGITGLAQVSGYRGEIKKPSDIINRVRLDIFYIENWSFLFDIKIIIKTILNVFRGEENAY